MTGQDEDFTRFRADNQRYECNKKKSPVATVTYTAAPAFRGADGFALEIVFPEGDYRNTVVDVRVE